MTDLKKTRVLGVAQDAFVRYGFRRVTMGHIAAEAGMSRPALYLLFPDKQAIFRAVLREFVDRIAEEVRAGLDEHATVADKLAFVFELWTVRPFELAREAPDARELTDCSHEFASDVVEDSRRGFEETLARILAPDADVLERHHLAPEQMAHVLSVATDGFKDRAGSVDELRALVAGLIDMTLATIRR